MIRTEQLTKVFTTEEVETTAVAAIDLEIKTGEFVAIMGPSGSGKSTLLNLLGLVDKPTVGKYFFRDQEVGRASERRRTDVRKNSMGFVFQSFNLIDELTVFENVELPLLYIGTAASERRKRVNEVLDRVGMVARGKHFPRQLSGGQQQRAAVARAVVGDPDSCG